MAVDFQGGSVCGDPLVIAGFHMSVDGTLGPTMYMPVGVTGMSLTPRWLNAMNFAHWLYNHAFRRMSAQHVRSLLGVLPTVIPGHMALLMRHDAADGADAHLLHSIRVVLLPELRRPTQLQFAAMLESLRLPELRRPNQLQFAAMLESLRLPKLRGHATLS